MLSGDRAEKEEEKKRDLSEASRGEESPAPAVLPPPLRSPADRNSKQGGSHQK